MVKIYNIKKGAEILIDENHHAVTLIPKTYEDDYPSIQIELRNIDFQRHTLKCDDCKCFKDDFGSQSLDWYLLWNKQKYRLDLSRLGKGRDKNNISWEVGYYFTGTKMRFLISTESIEKLEQELELAIDEERYEHCAFLRDRIEEHREGE